MSDDKKDQQFTIYTGADLEGFLATDPPSDWIVEGMLRTGRRRPSVLAGLSGAGKSTLSRQLAVDVMKGRPFLGRPTKRSRVIYWYNEESRGDFWRAIKILGYDFNKDEKLFAPPDDGSAGFAWLAHALKTCDAPLLILETLDDLLRVDDMNAGADARKGLEKLQQRLGEYMPKTNILALGQFRKKRSKTLAVENIYGSVFYQAKTDAKLLLERISDKDPRRIFSSEVREGVKTEPTYLHYDLATRTSALGRTVAEESRQSAQATIEGIHKRVHTYLAANPDSKLTNEIIGEHIGGNTTQVWKEIKILLLSGAITREGTGHSGDSYCYSNTPPIGVEDHIHVVTETSKEAAKAKPGYALLGSKDMSHSIQ